MRFSGIIMLGLLGLFSPFWVFVAGATLYVLFTPEPYELLILSVCLDASYSDPLRGVWYAYTLVASTLFIAIALVRPYLRFSA